MVTTCPLYHKLYHDHPQLGHQLGDDNHELHGLVHGHHLFTGLMHFWKKSIKASPNELLTHATIVGKSVFASGNRFFEAEFS